MRKRVKSVSQYKLYVIVIEDRERVTRWSVTGHSGCDVIQFQHSKQVVPKHPSRTRSCGNLRVSYIPGQWRRKVNLLPPPRHAPLSLFSRDRSTCVRQSNQQVPENAFPFPSTPLIYRFCL